MQNVAYNPSYGLPYVNFVSVGLTFGRRTVLVGYCTGHANTDVLKDSHL